MAKNGEFGPMSLVKQALLCVVLIALAAGGWYAWQNPQMVGMARESAGGESAASQGDASARTGGGVRIPGVLGPGGELNVITAKVENDPGGDRVTALGTAKAVRSITLFPQVTGVVTEVLFTPGQIVEAGTVLLRLEADEQSVAVDRTRVALKQAQAALQRSQALAKSKTIAAVALSDAEAAVQLAEIEVRTAEIALSRRSIAAPFGGVVGLTDLSLGDLVTTTTPITTLDDLATLRVAFEVPERWAPRIRLDQPVAATAQGLPASEFDGRVTAIDSRIDQATRTLRLEADLDNRDGVLKTGMAISVSLEFDTEEQLAVPTLSVLWDRQGSFVWKIADATAHRSKVTILSRQSGTVLVQGDLAMGDTVVVEGTQRLREGGKVKEVEAYAATAESAPDAAPEPAGAPADASPEISRAEPAAAARRS